MARALVGGDRPLSQAAKDRAESLVNQVISERYRIVELVAAGAMGGVYRAEHLLMHKEVAVKILHPETEGFPELVARFEREAVAGAHINHKNVASASDFGKFDGECRFLVQEFIRGQTLNEVIRRGPIPHARATSIARQLAGALGAAHSKGVVHRDVKPRNVMVVNGDLDGPGEVEVKLIDFGLAKVPVSELSTMARDYDAAPSLTQAGVVMGTVAYMAPETAMGMAAVQERADLYSLGLVFYEMLAGKHAFEADDPKLLFALQRTQPPPPVNLRNPAVTVPPALERVLMRLLEKDPDERYQTAEAFIAALDAVDNPPAEITTPATTVASLAPPRSTRRSVPWWLLLVPLVAAGAVFGVRQLRHSPEVATSAAPSAEGEAPASAGPAAAQSARDQRLLKAAADSDAARAATAVLAIAREDAAAFDDRTAQAAVATVAQRVAEAGGPEAEELFTTLAQKLGTAGIDVLYAIVSADESSKGAMRAHLWLARRDVLDRGTAAMRIAYELRRASCSRRQFLFTRAGDEGDDRALAVLMSMQPPTCDSMRGQCCFKRHGDLERAVSNIQARIATNAPH